MKKIKQAISDFNSQPNVEDFMYILKMLSDTLVWVPCNAVLGEQDQKTLLDMIEKADGDFNSLVGLELSSQENIRMIPDVLQNGDDFFFPAFLEPEDMGEYGENFSKVQKHFLDIIPLAENNEKDISGIVINAFTEPWVLDKEFYPLIEKIHAGLETE